MISLQSIFASTKGIAASSTSRFLYSGPLPKNKIVRPPRRLSFEPASSTGTGRDVTDTCLPGTRLSKSSRSLFEWVIKLSAGERANLRSGRSSGVGSCGNMLWHSMMHLTSFLLHHLASEPTTSPKNGCHHWMRTSSGKKALRLFIARRHETGFNGDNIGRAPTSNFKRLVSNSVVPGKNRLG